MVDDYPNHHGLRIPLKGILSEGLIVANKNTCWGNTLGWLEMIKTESNHETTSRKVNPRKAHLLDL